MTAHRTQAWEDLEAAAQAAASRGWRVFPLQVGGLLPAVRDWHDRATSDPERIERCWAAGAFNIGIAPCPSDLLVLDLAADDRDGCADTQPLRWRMPGVNDGADVLAVLADEHDATYPTETYTVRTPYGGMQLYFTHPQRKCPPNTHGPTGDLGWRIGLRTAGSYVPAAGTATAQGHFTVIHDVHPAPLPGWLDSLLPSRGAPDARGAA